MHLAEISFAGKIAYNIKDDATKKLILDELERKYNIKIIAKHFEKFQDSLMDNINRNPHLLSARSNGNQYIMLLTKFNLMNYCMFIDKKIQQGYYYPRIIIVNYHFDDELFNDTIFHGEMITLKNDKWIFIINDLHVYKAEYLKEYNLVKRLNIIYDILKNEYMPDEMDISLISVKKYFKYDQVNELLNDHIPKLPYTCRGIYIKPLFLRFKDILINFNDDIVKKVERVKYSNVFNNMPSLVKPISQPPLVIVKNVSSIDKQFFTRKTSSPDIYELFDENNNLIGTACVPTLKISKKMRELFTYKNVVDKILLDYQFNTNFNKFIPVIVS
jgi:hypothetical protein